MRILSQLNTLSSDEEVEEHEVSPDEVEVDEFSLIYDELKIQWAEIRQ